MAVDPQVLIGQSIRYYRRAYKMTQDDLADRLYMDRAAISRYENGTNGVMGIDILLRFCAALHVTPNDLLTEKKKENKSEWYDRLDPDNRKIADSMMEGLYLRQQMGH